MNDVLLIRAGDYHLAIPAEKLLEIVNLKLYLTQEKTTEKLSLAANTKLNPQSNDHASSTFSDNYRLWRQRVLSVMHLGHYLNRNSQKTNCAYSLVYQVNNDEILFLDVDQIYNIIHIDTSRMKPIYNPYKDLARLTTKIYEVQNPPTIAFILEDSLNLIDENKKFQDEIHNKIINMDLSIEHSQPLHSIEDMPAAKPKKRKRQKKEAVDLAKKIVDQSDT